ncbi:small basic family protein [Thermoanaerobacterium sp. RBIITD]|uniref:small basic family protein n=1 Tax=Thermoanaerobacterium sp. RBIITD TaxID=1550240 RepID=UPI000BB67E35|nr:small basic family protein [Thermoanaerobacterium sp. RBIITD]SNX52784.1 Small basic protein [Thermoanaerobacterium sp. RBIITD]
MVLIIFLSLLLGLAVGFFLPINLPPTYTSYLSVAILAALDSVFGGIRAGLEHKFNNAIFISGFFGNAILAAVLAYIGDVLGVPIYLAAIFAFGGRLFTNFAYIRRYILDNLTKKQ